MNTRIKVSSTGVIVVWEPRSKSQMSWFAIYTPNLPPHAARQMFYTDDEVQDWPNWGPVS